MACQPRATLTCRQTAAAQAPWRQAAQQPHSRGALAVAQAAASCGQHCTQCIDAAQLHQQACSALNVGLSTRHSHQAHAVRSRHCILQRRQQHRFSATHIQHRHSCCAIPQHVLVLASEAGTYVERIPEWTLDQIAGMAFAVRGLVLLRLRTLTEHVCISHAH